MAPQSPTTPWRSRYATAACIAQRGYGLRADGPVELGEGRGRDQAASRAWITSDRAGLTCPRAEFSRLASDILIASPGMLPLVGSGHAGVTVAETGPARAAMGKRPIRPAQGGVAWGPH